MLFGSAAIERLRKAHVILFGLGGVGSFTAEALARAGIGKIDLVDNDSIGLTNLNRQLVALHSTIDEQKTAVMKKRIMDINPAAEVAVHDIFLSAETAEQFCFAQYDYVLDAIDTVSAKLILADLCCKAGTPLISAMGTGNKIDPTQLRVMDIYKTSGDPLARVMRRELKKRGIKKLKVVCSLEEPRKLADETAEDTTRRSLPASSSFVPPVAGMILAGECIKDLVRDLL